MEGRKRRDGREEEARWEEGRGAMGGRKRRDGREEEARWVGGFLFVKFLNVRIV